MKPNAGIRISVSWPLHNQFYSGIVDSVDDDGSRNVKYADGDQEKLQLDAEKWKYDKTLEGNTVMMELESSAQHVLSKMMLAL